jgi:hypothetical protein
VIASGIANFSSAAHTNAICIPLPPTVFPIPT